MTPADDFAAMFADDAPALEGVEVVDTSPRAPRPNMAQGATAEPVKNPDPAQAFVDAINDTFARRRGDGGWT